MNVRTFTFLKITNSFLFYFIHLLLISIFSGIRSFKDQQFVGVNCHGFLNCYYIDPYPMEILKIATPKIITKNVFELEQLGFPIH